MKLSASLCDRTSKVTIIYTMRHAQTQFNTERRYAGSIDVELDAQGTGDASKISPCIQGLNLDVVITSSLKRSIQTANLLLGNSVPVVQNALCTERNFGIMEGRTWDEIQVLQPPVMLIQVGNDLHSVNPKGGEALEDVWARAKRFRGFIFAHYRGKKILVISHGVFLQMFHGLLRGLNCIESLAAYPANLELARFEFSGRRLIRESVDSLNGAQALRW